MSATTKNRAVLLIIALLTLTAAWLILGKQIDWGSNEERTYASGFHEPQLDDPLEAQRMREEFEAIVARRDLKMPLEKQKEIARLFHDLEIWENMWFLGVPIQKNPCDLWMMQQIIYETRPDVIVETGTFRGGSALYFAHVLQGMGLDESKVITVDIEDACQAASTLPLWQKHVEFILGSSIDPEVAAQIRAACQGKRVMVVLDSVHAKPHVLEELELYAPLVSPGSYVVVEDTNSDGVPLFPGCVGPTAAVREFLATPEGASFTQDVSREAMVLTFNPGGWLKREEAPRDHSRTGPPSGGQ